MSYAKLCDEEKDVRARLSRVESILDSTSKIMDERWPKVVSLKESALALSLELLEIKESPVPDLLRYASKKEEESSLRGEIAKTIEEIHALHNKCNVLAKTKAEYEAYLAKILKEKEGYGVIIPFKPEYDYPYGQNT